MSAPFIFPDDEFALGPAESGFAITKSDASPLAYQTRAIYVGTAGDLAVKLRRDSVAVTFKNVPAGSLLPIRANFVMSTGTTASDLVGLCAGPSST